MKPAVYVKRASGKDITVSYIFDIRGLVLEGKSTLHVVLHSLNGCEEHH